MSGPAHSRPGTIEICSTLARWILGGVFLFMGLSKVVHPVEFLKLTRQYDLTQNYFALNAIAALLPWFEVACGSLLVLGVGVRGTALLCLLMLIPFTWVVFEHALRLHATQGIPLCSLKFDCGCGNGEVYVCFKLPENLGLILLGGWLLVGRSRLCLRQSLFAFKPAAPPV